MTVEYNNDLLNSSNNRQTIDHCKLWLELFGYDQKDVGFLLLVLRSLSPVPGKPIHQPYLGYYHFFNQASTEMGYSISTVTGLQDDELETLVVNRLVTYDNPPPKDSGVTRSLSHGFYRNLTLLHIFEFVIKQRYSDQHCLLIESEFRNIMFKQSEYCLSDTTRSAMFCLSGVADQVGIIRGIEFNNRFYRKLVNIWKPDIYFVNQSAGKDAISEAKYRAKIARAELIITPEISGLHTTDLDRSAKNFYGSLLQ